MLDPSEDYAERWDALTDDEKLTFATLFPARYWEERCARAEGELAAARAVIAAAHGILSWRPNHDGDDPARVEQDYMHRAQLADESFSILSQSPTNALQAVKAAAWDECLDAIEQYELNTAQAREGNPYRKGETDE